MNGLHLAPLAGPAQNDLPVEVVERKGKGHPDTICDALVEEVSSELLRHYEREFGSPLHHNVDKALLWAGVAQPEFGGGRVERPMRISLAGRATMALEGRPVPVADLATAAAEAWLGANLHAVDPPLHAEIEPLFRPGSAELVELFLRQQRTGEMLANDTSCGVGFAPLSDLERVVAAVERELTAPETTQAHPEIGEDVKVMGVRLGERVDLTVACAFIGRYVEDLAAYARAKEQVADIALQAARRVTDRPVGITVNAADDPESGSVYLTVTGTSAEGGDDGQAGRGNRVTGLITPYRPMVLESAPGKNPVTHTGKVYAVAAQQLAADLVQRVPGATQAHCLLLSRIGGRIDRPHVVDVGLGGVDADALEDLRLEVEAVVEERLASLKGLWRELLSGRISVLDTEAAPTS